MTLSLPLITAEGKSSRFTFSLAVHLSLFPLAPLLSALAGLLAC